MDNWKDYINKKVRCWGIDGLWDEGILVGMFGDKYITYYKNTFIPCKEIEPIKPRKTTPDEKFQFVIDEIAKAKVKAVDCKIDLAGMKDKVRGMDFFEYSRYLLILPCGKEIPVPDEVEE